MTSPHLTILHESPPERCEICHQTDQFDPQTGVCQRCAELATQPPSNANWLWIRLTLRLGGAILLFLGLAGGISLYTAIMLFGIDSGSFLGAGCFGIILAGLVWRGWKKRPQAYPFESVPNESTASEPFSPILKAVPAEMFPILLPYRQIIRVTYFVCILGYVLVMAGSGLCDTMYHKNGVIQGGAVFVPQSHYYLMNHGHLFEVTQFHYRLVGTLSTLAQASFFAICLLLILEQLLFGTIGHNKANQKSK